MTTINNLATPATLVNLDTLTHNINAFQKAASQQGKELWPMIKTHKSTEIALMQIMAGATGVLCGTLDEAEACSQAGIMRIMYAYPVASAANIQRVIELAKKTDFIIRLDTVESARLLNEAATKADLQLQYSLIINSGLNRFGVLPADAAAFASQLAQFTHLHLVGISTHPGHVYAASCKAELDKYVYDEKTALKTASEGLVKNGFALQYVTSGSTPTFWGALDDQLINVYHPGNYVFMDTIQMSTETAAEQDCALRILATIISHPAPDLYICDAGAKCLGLDQGAHGNSAITGFGRIVGHPELVMYSLSEEVGKMHATGPSTITVGDKIQIIPNHACAAANLTSYLVGFRQSQAERVIEVDMRSNSTKKLR